MIRKFILSAILASAGIGLVAVQGCSSSSSSNGVNCSSKGSCANDPAPSQAQIDQCTQAANDATCGNAYQAAANCVLGSGQVCTAAGTTDLVATTSKCQAQINTYAQCKAGGDAAPPPPDGGGDVIGPGGDCSTLCSKAANVASCSGIASTCLNNCQNPMGLPATCQSQYNALIHCAATTGTISGCTGSQVSISGCDAELAALTACITPPPSDGGGDGPPPGDGGNCGIMGGTPMCTACINAMCCSEAMACAGDNNCGMVLLTCLNNCAMTDGGTACQQACAAQAGMTAVNEFNALATCVMNSCVGAGGC